MAPDRGRRVLWLIVVVSCTSTSRELFAEGRSIPNPSQNDLIIVFPSTTARTAIVRATQRARKGVRTFVVNDRGPALDGNGIARKQMQLRIFHRPQVFGAYIGSNARQPAHRLDELRIALSPFLANLTIGSSNFKWILFGHDDTVWMVDNALKLLRGLDPDVPHLITDNVWFQDGSDELPQHPHGGAPFCLLCGKASYSDVGMRADGGAWRCNVGGREAPLGCPCNRSALAQTVMGRELLDPATLDFRDPTKRAAYRLHIGSGVIMSRGLFNAGDFDRVHAWMKARGHESADADALFTSTLWDLMEIAASRPGHDYCSPGLTLFDPGWRDARERAEGGDQRDGGNDPLGVVGRLESVMAGESESCDKTCMARLDGMVSVHVRQSTAAEALSAQMPGVSNAPPRYNATVSLIAALTDHAEKFQRQRWAQEQFFMATGNR